MSDQRKEQFSLKSCLGTIALVIVVFVAFGVLAGLFGVWLMQGSI